MKTLSAGRRVIWIATAILLTSALAGCLTPGEMQARHEMAQDQTCQNYGFKPGTDGYGNCRLELNRQAAAERRAFEANAWWNQPLPQQQRTSCMYNGQTIYGNTSGTMTCQ
jgi:hypothetical protein